MDSPRASLRRPPANDTMIPTLFFFGSRGSLTDGQGRALEGACSRSQAHGLACSRCPTNSKIEPPPEKPRRSHKNDFRLARVTMNARSGACGTGCRSARRWHGQIGAARTATYLHARFPALNLDNMMHNALNNIINNLAHHQHFSSPQAPVVHPARARSTHKCLTLRARFLPIANRPAPSHMLFLLLHSSLTSLCSLLHSTLQATCTRALAWPRTVHLEAGWSAEPPCSKRHCLRHAATPQPCAERQRCE